MAKTSKSLEGTKQLMGALVRMKPKPHEEMKISAQPRKTKARKKKAKPGN